MDFNRFTEKLQEAIRQAQSLASRSPACACDAVIVPRLTSTSLGSCVLRGLGRSRSRSASALDILASAEAMTD